MPAVFPPALTPFLDLLRCPVCSAGLRPDPGSLRCGRGHTFNIARQLRQSSNGYPRDQRRRRFHGAGQEPISRHRQIRPD